MFTKIWNTIMDFIYMLLEWAVMLLPLSPFQKFKAELNGTFPNVLGQINFFIPVGPMVTFFISYLTCVAVWYIARWAMRLTKYIG